MDISRQVGLNEHKTCIFQLILKRKLSDNEKTEESSPKDNHFWFGNEDPAHVRTIVNSYCNFLRVCVTRRPCTRSPLQFIGCIERLVLAPEPTECPNDSSSLQTLDEISVYQRDMVPMGYAMTLLRKEWLCTHWDASDGLPIRHLKINPEKLGEWRARIAPNSASCYLDCLPVFNTDTELMYSSRRDRCGTVREVGYSNPISHCIYQSFLSIGRPLLSDNAELPESEAFGPSSLETKRHPEEKEKETEEKANELTQLHDSNEHSVLNDSVDDSAAIDMEGSTGTSSPVATESFDPWEFEEDDSMPLEEDGDLEYVSDDEEEDDFENEEPEEPASRSQPSLPQSQFPSRARSIPSTIRSKPTPPPDKSYSRSFEEDLSAILNTFNRPSTTIEPFCFEANH